MKIVRYILFIPAAFLASVIISALTKFVGSMLFGDIIGGIVSGFGGVSFIMAGLYVSPNKTDVLKNVLAVVLLLVSILAVYGSQLNTEYTSQIWAPVFAAIIAISSFTRPADKLINQQK